jgi:protein SCO1/2
LYVDLRCWKYPSAVSALIVALLGGCDRVATQDRAAGAAVPTALAAAALTDEQGRARSFADFRGKTVVFSLFFTSCPTVCPRETRALSEVQKRLSPALRQRVQFLTLSVDPENDTPELMRQFALSNGAELSGWSFVRTTSANTQALGQQLAAFEGPAKAQAEPSGHTTAVYLFDGSGRLMQRYGGSPLDVPRLAAEVERLDVWFGKEVRADSIEVTTLK